MTAIERIFILDGGLAKVKDGSIYSPRGQRRRADDAELQCLSHPSQRKLAVVGHGQMMIWFRSRMDASLPMASWA
jgi:hypothetical protein